MGNAVGTCVGRSEDYDYYDPENKWKCKQRIEFKRKLGNEATKGQTRGEHETPGGTLTGDTLIGWNEEIIEAPNGDKIYITPIGYDEETPDGGKRVNIQDMPLDMVFDNYGPELYVEEYQKRFSDKPNIDIFKKGPAYQQRMTVENRPSTMFG